MSQSPGEPLLLAVPESLVGQVAERAAALVLARIGHAAAASPFLTVAEAAVYLRAKPQRVYDLLSTRRLTRFKDGRRVLVSRAELDAYLAATGPRPVACTLPPTAQSRTSSGLAG